jgi:predicted branched-subunit amino acid permease
MKDESFVMVTMMGNQTEYEMEWLWGDQSQVQTLWAQLATILSAYLMD